ncbi:hypothetical protein GCM10010982_12270 [Bowmanella pacifica]|uniref:Uncharacterized protein n=1 Tax=Bowmanella pacifica TaxID=502051 RepID=A0A917YUF9_9ALTE|nr:hypothetical protein GCM10010982_12270 [Bowmanella pacifica]
MAKKVTVLFSSLADADSAIPISGKAGKYISMANGHKATSNIKWYMYFLFFSMSVLFDKFIIYVGVF